MAREIQSVGIIGMGALGTLFGKLLMDALDPQAVTFLMDRRRLKRHEAHSHTVNGKEISFRLATPGEGQAPCDLIIVATKANGLTDAIETLRPSVGQDTLIISLLNGITSEEELEAAFGPGHVIHCVALGMDAVYADYALTFTHPGRLQIGVVDPGMRDGLRRLERFLKRAGIAFETPQDIRLALWTKCMLNTGINQTCMIYDIPYGPAVEEGSEPYRDLCAVMREAQQVAAAEGAVISEEAFQGMIALMRSLDPAGYPSMQQDHLARRKSEVELFSGTILRYARKHGIDAPVNERYYQRIREIEERYPEKDPYP